MADFNVETYTVSVGASSGDRYDPYISLVSPDLSHGIRNTADLYFRPLTDLIKNHNAIGWVLNVGGLNYNGLKIIAYLSTSAYDDIYTIIRTESPIKVYYYYKDKPDDLKANHTLKLLTSIRVGTGMEMPGEGDGDSDASFTLFERSIMTG